MQQQGRKLFVPVHELFDVVFHLNTRVDDRPKMSGSDKCKKREDILATFAAEGVSQPLERTLGLHRVHEDQRAKGEQLVFDFGIRGGPIDRRIHSLQAAVNRFEVPPPRRGRLQKLDHLLNGLRCSRGVAR